MVGWRGSSIRSRNLTAIRSPKTKPVSFDDDKRTPQILFGKLAEGPNE